MLPMENDTEPKVKTSRANDDSVSEREGDEDRLSELPDSVLTHVMTFMSSKDSVRTSVLSKRWKDLWKRVPSLKLCTSDFQFRPVTLFNRFVAPFLTHRDKSISFLILDFRHHGHVPIQLLRMVVKYALSHNVKQLTLHVDCDMDLPPAIFCSKKLTSLDLLLCTRYLTLHRFPESLNTPNLTILHIRNFKFCANKDKVVEPFSSCVSLKSLILVDCVMSDHQILCISNDTLVNLTIRSPFLLYRDDSYEIELSTPNLCSFTFSGIIDLPLEANNLCCLKEINIDARVRSAWRHSALILISWLHVFANIRSLTVCSSTLQVLSAVPDILNTENPCLDNLESLIVNVKTSKALKPPAPGLDRAVDFLIRNSPFAKVTKIDCTSSVEVYWPYFMY